MTKMNNDIPFEILVLIADKLSIGDRLKCTLICKAWNAPFQSSLWKLIIIKSQEKLDKICTDPTIQKNIYHLNGQHSQELYIEFDGKVTDTHLRALRLCFPNLRRLSIKTGLISSTIFDDTHDPKLWRSLTYLNVCSSRDDLGSMAEAHLDILKFTPYLKRLEFTGYNGGEGKCTWQDIETVHMRLPKLEHLRICMEGYTIERDEMVAFKNIVPATNIITLATGIFEWDIQWAYYFACKYPNIQSMDCSFEPISSDSDDYEKIFPLISGVQNPFQYLKKIKIYESMLPGCVHGSIIRILNGLNVNLKTIKYKVDSFSDEDIKDTANHAIHRMLHSNSTSLEKFSVDCQVDLSLTNLFNNIGICKNLVELQLTLQMEEIWVDKILDHSKALKKLTISSHICMHLRVLSNTIAPHGLETLEIYDSAIRVDSFKNLSFGCRMLKRMVINNVSVYGTISPINGELRIDMEHTNFTYLRLDKVHFDQDGEVLGRNTSINFFALCPLELSQRQEVNLYGSVSCADTPNSLWTHLYHDFMDDNMCECMRILKKDEAAYVEDYFKSFQKNLKNAVTPDYERYANDSEANSKMWKYDLVRGFVTFRCGKAEQYEVMGYILNDTELIKLPEKCNS
ncbi:hypothetical protein CLU79DRAFT_890725 [Phycomyces nitens]|nr:hypothetical protein CLU79DRAFT_890725 [Phycomyces nitens]